MIICEHFRICGKKLCLGRGICDDDADHAVVYCKQIITICICILTDKLFSQENAL